MKPVAKEPRVQLRGSTYWHRVKVPKKIRHVLNKAEICQSLHTSNYRDAVRKARIASINIDARFKVAEHQVDGGTPTSLTDADMLHAVRAWFHTLEMKSLQGLKKRSREEREVAKDLAIEDQFGLENGGIEDPSFQGVAKDFMASHGIRHKEGSRDWWAVVELVHRALLEHNKRRISRFEDHLSDRRFDDFFRDVDANAPPPKAATKRTTLSQLIQAYKKDAEHRVTAKTSDGYTVIFRVLEELLGSEQFVDQVSREECRAIRDLLLRVPPNASKRFPKLSLTDAADRAKSDQLATLSKSTVNSYMNNLSALFKWAVQEGHIEKNPAEGSGIPNEKKRARGRRLPFNVEQLNAIFSAPLYTGCQDDQKGYAKPGNNHPRRGRFWVPLLSLWSGMRLNECCQLDVADVARADGVDLFYVRPNDDESGDKKVKTKASDRIVPLHPELVRLGFLDYVAMMRESGQHKLFPELRVGAKGYYSDPFQKWFGRFLVAAKAKRPKTSFHSFRHSFRDALREADVSLERVRVIGGWAEDGGAEAGYGAGFRPSTLAKEIAKVQYPGLDLKHLHSQLRVRERSRPPVKPVANEPTRRA